MAVSGIKWVGDLQSVKDLGKILYYIGFAFKFFFCSGLRQQGDEGGLVPSLLTWASQERRQDVGHWEDNPFLLEQRCASRSIKHTALGTVFQQL